MPDAEVSTVTMIRKANLGITKNRKRSTQFGNMVASFSLFTICCAVLLASVQSFSPTNVAVRSNVRGSTIVMDGKTRDLRDRIKSIKNTRRITEAMRLVAAARVRRAQEAVLKTRPLISQLQLVIISHHMNHNQGCKFYITTNRSTVAKIMNYFISEM